jgi:hypothetical protein
MQGRIYPSKIILLRLVKVMKSSAQTCHPFALMDLVEGSKEICALGLLSAKVHWYEHEVSLFENVPGSKGVLDIGCHAVERHVVATDHCSVLISCSRCFNETLFQPQCMSVKALNAKAHQIWMAVSHRATLALVDAEPRRRLNMTTQDPSSQRLTGSTLLVNGDRGLTSKLFPARAEKTGYLHGLTNREGLIYESRIKCSYISHRSLSRL